MMNSVVRIWVATLLTVPYYSYATSQRIDKVSCSRVPMHTAAAKTPGDNGFAVKVLGDPPAEYYEPGKTYSISVNGTYTNQAFLDFMLVAVPRGANDERKALGSWKHASAHNRLTKNDENCENVLTSVVFHASFKKPGVTVQWLAPPGGSGCVEFRATVVEYTDIWYKDEGGLTRVFCEKPAGADSRSLARSRGNASAILSPSVTKECCACGVAKYEMTFYGNWTPESHPKDYPSGPYASLLHWSNIVGASHSKAYSLWSHGELATNGIKEVCEFGWPKALEAEIKTKGDDIRTVIKTNGIWGAEAIRKETRSARFSTDRRRHLMSLITMIGPSPDWCIGVSSLDLCLPDCGWRDSTVVELYPWDAGTDSGITYMSENAATYPRQRITPLTNVQPNNPASPFHGPQPVKPFATVVVRRLDPESSASGAGQAPRCDAITSGSDVEDSTATGSADPKCMLTEWSEFSDCSATCGVGIKMRRRSFKNPAASVHMCPPGIVLQESEHCLGVINECPEDEDASRDPACATTGYSSWSPCSVTCGQGLQSRTRLYRDPGASAKCNATLVQMQGCTADIVDCGKAEATKDWEAICRMPKEEGRCRGIFPRWYYDFRMKKCLPFNYGGCRGNENLFLTSDDCEARCLGTLSRERVDCMVTPWSEWTECSATCSGGDGKQMRLRMVKRPMANGGEACPDDLSEAQPCGAELPRCSERPSSDSAAVVSTADCMVTPWSDWSDCSVDCGLGNMTRLRMIKQPAGPGGTPCPTDLIASKICYISRCKPTDCMVTPWLEWSTCTATCGLGKTMRQRMVKLPAANGGQACPTDLVEAHVCSNEDCVAAIDCMVTPWGEWSPCSGECEMGEQSRARMVKQPAVGTGLSCPDGLLEKRTCPLRACGKRRTRTSTTATTVATAGAVDCTVTDWTSWTPCSRPCGTGRQMKIRIVSSRAKGGGKRCPKLKEYRLCNEKACAGGRPQ